jgi:hypothetical protein
MSWEQAAILILLWAVFVAPVLKPWRDKIKKEEKEERDEGREIERRLRNKYPEWRGKDRKAYKWDLELEIRDAKRAAANRREWEKHNG